MASLLFYSWGEGIYILILLGSIGFNHYISLNIERQKSRKSLIIGLAGNLLLLAVFKYLNWIFEEFGLLSEPSKGFDVPLIHLPLGISFFTFQAISMLIDVYRGQKPAKNIFDTGLYIAMFPQLIAGPIVRFNDIHQDILRRRESFSKFSDGAFIFIIGLSQKVLLADTLAISADAAFSAPAQELSFTTAWFGLICFSLQIFYDFAGYSNMAIGLGRFFGFELPRNFNYPYSAVSFQDFWRRWHMTLSRWFRDYLYIPLGGSRGGSIKTYRNLFIVFILCGIWHGAAWTFLFWGLWHGAFLTLERLVGSVKIAVPKLVAMAYVWLFVALGWVLFRAENLPHALDYWTALSGLSQPSVPAHIDISRTTQISLVLAIICMWGGWENSYNRTIKEKYLQHSKVQFLSQSGLWGAAIVLYLLCFFSIAAQTHQTFIYFRF
ncbi:MAG: MBOAT family O-acyltransferase [Litorimonas sp.]